MTGATSIFPWDFLNPTSQNPTLESSVASTPAPHAPDTRQNVSDAFQLVELHQYWFGDSPKAASADHRSQDTCERTEQENGTIAYRVLEIAPDTVKRDQDALSQHNGIAAVNPGNLAETLASAERVMQNLTDLPPHSRLEASLTALEAALAGVSLSDLEAALAVTGTPAARYTGK